MSFSPFRWISDFFERWDRRRTEERICREEEQSRRWVQAREANRRNRYSGYRGEWDVGGQSDEAIRETEMKRRMYRMGNDFEDYVRGMFPEERFDLLHRTPTHEETGGKYVKSMGYPDLRFREKGTGRRFWVEVKYRSHADSDGSIVWCTEAQLSRYKHTMHGTGEKVFVIMGVGGTTSDPDKVYCLDLDLLNFTKLFYSTYRDHRIMFGKVECLILLEYISSYERP